MGELAVASTRVATSGSLPISSASSSRLALLTNSGEISCCISRGGRGTCLNTEAMASRRRSGSASARTQASASSSASSAAGLATGVAGAAAGADTGCGRRPGVRTAPPAPDFLR